MRWMSASDNSQFLLPQILAQRTKPLRRVDQLDITLALGRLSVAEQPDIGGDSSIVENVERQGDDRLQPVVLDDPAADIALALPGVRR